MNTMTGKQRLLAAIKGEPVDRPPIWLREGFNIGGELLTEPMQEVLGGGADPEFLLGWKHDPL
jgi:uroporphyrinogen-III decarboxylase